MTLADRIKKHEGYRREPYQDTRGFWTVGWGHLIHHIRPQAWATLGDLLEHVSSPHVHEKWFEQDLARAERDAKTYIGAALFAELSPNRQNVLVEMAFQLGGAGLRSFVKLKKAIEEHRWIAAGEEILDSRLAKQTPERAKFYANQMSGG